jgi:hypothetical protein
MADEYDYLVNDMDFRFRGPGIYADHFCTLQFYLDKDGKFHRDDGPAIHDAKSHIWYRHGLRHREGDLPAMDMENGDKAWYREGQKHRETGPAVIYGDGRQEWWLKGRQVSEDEFKAQEREKIDKWRREEAAQVAEEIRQGLQKPVLVRKPPGFIM